MHPITCSRVGLRTALAPALPIICAFATLMNGGPTAAGEPGLAYSLPVSPREDLRQKDAHTGADLLFLTSGDAKNKDGGLYFHQVSWLADDSIILFHSGRPKGGLMGYVVATGELFPVLTADGNGMGASTAALHRNSVFAIAGERVLEILLSVQVSDEQGKPHAQVTARERLLATVKGLDGNLNESCDGRYLSVGRRAVEGEQRPTILLIDERTGATTRLCEMPDGVTYHSHVQFSMTNPNWLSFAGEPYRLWVVDVRTGKPWAPYKEWKGELVTHESWWVNDQLIFCGGPHAAPTEESHVKTIDLRAGTVRIVGAGSWWPEGTSKDLARRNWWHASGSRDGRWIAADNWHGDIMLFEGPTTRPRLLTSGHRTYGSGTHPEVGWDRHGEQVVFSSHQRGGPAVCVATIPPAWQKEVTAARVGLEAQ